MIKTILIRLIDYSIFYLLITLSSLFLPVSLNEYFYGISALAVPVLWAPLEALSVSLWGTTLGNALFDRAVRNEEGKKLTFFQGLKRAFFLGRYKVGNVIHQEFSWGHRLLILAIALFSIYGVISEKGVKKMVYNIEQQARGDWVRYYSAEGKFTIDFPTDPLLEENQLEISSANRTLDYNEYKSVHKENEDIYYSVSFIDLPKKWRFLSSNTLLKGALSVLLENETDSKVLGKTISSYKGTPALDYNLKNEEYGQETHARLVLDGLRLYKLTVTYPTSMAGELHPSEFLESFVLNG